MALTDPTPAEMSAQERGITALQPIPPVLLVLTGATSIQFGAALAATLFDDLGPGGTSLLRLGLAAIVLLAFWRPRPSRHPAAHVRLAVLFGLVLGAMNLCFYEAIDRLPLGPTVTIEFIGPIGLAALLSRRRLDFVWIACAVAGILLLARPWSSDQPLDAVGLVFVAAAALFWALYIVLAQRAGRVFSGGEGLAIAMAAGSLVPLIPGIAQGGMNLLDPGLLAAGFGVALLSSVIPYSLETEALRRIPTRVFGVLMSLEPALATFAGLVILDQRLSAADLVAVALVVAASIGVTQSAPPLAPEALLDA